jgi:GNAT superfamily N-acetyltransferase
MNIHLKIREVDTNDVSSLAVLAGELGYPTSTAAMHVRLAGLMSAADHAIFVAEGESILGWIHVSVMRSLESDAFAEIRGLVVAETHRGLGIGTRLVAQAEAWARTAGCRRIRVRTNVVRDEARRFYAKLGFVVKKTQEVFDKAV